MMASANTTRRFVMTGTLPRFRKRREHVDACVVYRMDDYRVERGNDMTTTRGITFGIGAVLIAFASAGCGDVKTPEETQVAGALTSSSPGDARAVCGNWHFVGRPFRPDCSGVPDGGLCQCGPWRPPGIDDFEDGDVVFGPQDTGVWFLLTDGTGTQTPATAEGLVVPSSLRGNR